MDDLENSTKVFEGIPASLAALLKAIRTDILKADQREMAEILNQARRVPKGLTFSRGTVRKIENRLGVLRYEHLETYARAIGLPMAVLHFVSRYQRGKLSEGTKVLGHLQHVVGDAEAQKRDYLTVGDLTDLCQKINLQERSPSQYVKDLPIFSKLKGKTPV